MFSFIADVHASVILGAIALTFSLTVYTNLGFCGISSRNVTKCCENHVSITILA
jgi:hypothetical protein